MNLKNLNKHGVISTVLIVSAFLIAALGVSQGDVLAQSMSINKTTAAAVSAPTSPTGTVQSVTPKFVWEGVNGASLYSFVVLKGTNIVYSKLVTNSSCNGSNVCSNTPVTQLADGHYTWKVRANVATVWSSYSSPLSFTVNTAPTLTFPMGGLITGNTPTFTWTRIPNATQYNYVVGGLYNTIISSSSCGSNTSICSVTPAHNMGDGSYTWKVRAYVHDAWRPYSSISTFQVDAVPQLSAPSGVIINTTPAFTWSEITGATSYHLALYKGSVNLYTKIVKASSCDSSTSTCTSTPTTVLSSGAYTWKVSAYIGNVWKAYSATTSFSVSIPTSADYEFTNNANGWTKLLGAWNVGSGYYQATGTAGNFASSQTSTTYGTLTYEVRMKRVGDPALLQGIYFSGTAGSLQSGVWRKGYLFAYTNNGTYAIFEMSNGELYYLQEPTASSALTATFNTLKVTFNNTTGVAHFYINGTEVADATLADYLTGQIGLTFAADPSYTGDKLYVDYAKVSNSAPSTAVSMLTTGGTTFSDSSKVKVPSGISSLFDTK